MKRILLPILAIILAACLSPSGDQPAPTALPTATLPAPTQLPPTPTTIPSATPDPLDSLSPEVRGLVSEAEIREILGSIEDGSIEYVDYGIGSITEAQIDFESFHAQETADFYFDTIVTAQAKDKDGKEFKVVWNKDENHWVKVTDITEDVTFMNIDKMIGNGDMDLVLYGQEFVKPDLVESSIDPQYWVNFEMDRYPDNEFFLTLSNNPVSDFRPHTVDFAIEGFFGPENQPYQNLQYVNGITSDGVSFKAGLKPVVNKDRSVIIFKLGLDNRQAEVIMSNSGGKTLSDMISQLNPVPVFSFPNEIHEWDYVFKNHGGGNGKKYGLRVPADYVDDVIVAMHESRVGELFLSLPQDVQEKLIAAIMDKKLSPDKDNNKLNVFLENGISVEMAMILSRNIHVTMFDQLPSFNPHQ